MSAVIHTHILIHVECLDIFERDVSLFVMLNKFLVCPSGGATLKEKMGINCVMHVEQQQNAAIPNEHHSNDLG